MTRPELLLTLRGGYLVDEVAVDIARLTGVNWEMRKLPPAGWRPCVDLKRLSWWDRWRVAWALIGAHAATGA